MGDQDFEAISGWYNACNPDISPDSISNWYVALDPWVEPGGDRVELRGPPVAERLVRAVRLAASQPDRRSAHLFSGFRGTGKTTELHRVATILKERGFFVLQMRADAYFHMSEALAAEEMALVLAAGIGEAAAAQLGVTVLHAASIWERIRQFLASIQPPEVTVGFAGFEIKALLQKGGDFRERLRNLVGDRPERLKGFLHALVEEIADAVYPRQVAILVDGLEKFYAPLDRIGLVYQSMADLFFHQADLLCLPRSHVVSTVPPYLAFLNAGIAERYGAGRLHLLCSVKVHERPPGRAVFPPGHRALVELLSRRVDLGALFGSAREDAVAALVSASGGHVRDLFLLVREVLDIALERGLPIDAKAAQDAVRRQAGGRVLIFEDTRAILQRVAREGELSLLSKQELAELANAMDQHLVLGYQNGSAWYDVHPLVEASIVEE